VVGLVEDEGGEHGAQGLVVALQVAHRRRGGQILVGERPDGGGDRAQTGVAPNELTALEDRDWIAGTPWHKHTAARIEAV